MSFIFFKKKGKKELSGCSGSIWGAAGLSAFPQSLGKVVEQLTLEGHRT